MTAWGNDCTMGGHARTRACAILLKLAPAPVGDGWTDVLMSPSASVHKDVFPWMAAACVLSIVQCCVLQAQDRCHRIGQTREVHIYRLVSESTIEENILHKSDQKRQLDHLAIQSGGFNTDFLQKFNPRELLGIQGETHTMPE